MKDIIVLLDFEKAFDTINWSFLHKTLIAFGFGDYFRKWIKVLYNKISACCMNNGHASTNFALSRGIRQGCPVSALLFLLVAEILAIRIRTNEKILEYQYKIHHSKSHRWRMIQHYLLRTAAL